MAENEQQGQQSGENNQNGQGETTFTQEQLDQAIETRLSRERETFEKNKAQMRADLTAEIRKQLQAESKSLEEMNETERANYERDQAIKAKEDLERKLNRSNTEKNVTEMLSEESIPSSKELCRNTHLQSKSLSSQFND
ncbi:capsid assembly scaffolding protein Gp46 family protein [Pediococcus pentosaceus]|uniref:capsid assembly scaffolding protein Gp46 family protein n=1 Tax=Pediococcus pentosaceus TaxID=1255 RepID=UPI0040359F89